MIRYIMVAIMALGLLACGSNEAEELKALEENVMAVHDEVMPKMGTISALNDSLKQLYTVHKLDSLDVDSALLAEIDGHITALSRADEAMMQWMRNYERPGEDMPADEKRTYLEAEQEKINEVRDEMLNAIAEAEAFLAKEKGEEDETME